MNPFMNLNMSSMNVVKGNKVKSYGLSHNNYYRYALLAPKGFPVIYQVIETRHNRGL